MTYMLYCVLSSEYAGMEDENHDCGTSGDGMETGRGKAGGK